MTLPPEKLDCKRVPVAPGVNGPGRKLDPLHFAEEKSVESVTESEEDLEPWEQTVAGEHLPPQEPGPGLPSTGSAPAGVETPSILEGTPHPLDVSSVQDGEADTVVRTRDLRGGGDGRFLQFDGRGQPGDRQDTSSASAILARPLLRLRDRGREVLGIPLMQHLVIGVPLERTLRLRTLTTIRGPDWTCVHLSPRILEGMSEREFSQLKLGIGLAGKTTKELGNPRSRIRQG